MHQGRRILAVAALSLALGVSDAAAQSHNISTVQDNLGTPVGVTALPDGGYLIAEQAGRVRRVSADGTPTTIADELTSPSAAVALPDGGYLVAETNANLIRRVAPDGTISTVAGGGGSGLGDDGAATAAQLAFPFDVAAQPDSGYLIADTDNNRIRRVAPNGIITTVAGGGAGADGGPALGAQLVKPSGIALTPDGGYLIADTDQHRVRKVSFDGTITTVAGTGAAGLSGDGGPATSAELNRPVRAVPDKSGGFVIADQMNARLRRVAPDGTITTVAGTTAGFSGDGKPATDAQMNNVLGAAVTVDGDYLVADTSNNRIRRVDADPPVPTLTATAPASPADENSPRILGSAAPGTTVAIFANDTCAHPSAAGGTASELATSGIAVTVPDNTTTTFRAVAVDSSGNSSPCSPSSLTYVEKSEPAPPPPPTTLPPPVQGKLVNAVPEKGKVLVKLPPGKGGPKARAAAAGFVPLETIGRQLPVGSTLDTTRGTVRLTSANNSSGVRQVGHFANGLFNFTQTRKNPLTTLSMTGGGLGACSKLPRGGSRKVAAARKRKRSLFSRVKGRFRTRGRNSAATVRGTSWRMTDTCKGTLTSVTTGSVVVRDFRLRKNRTVRAGHSYFARAPLRNKRLR